MKTIYLKLQIQHVAMLHFNTGLEMVPEWIFPWLEFYCETTSGGGGRCDWMHCDSLFTPFMSCALQASGGNMHHFHSAVAVDNNMLSLSPILYLLI